MSTIEMVEDTASLAASVSDDAGSYVETEDLNSIASTAMNTSSIQSCPNRVSMEEYYHRIPPQAATRTQPSPSPEPLEAPPSYDASVQTAALRRRYSIQPREDEGCEQLPGYSSSISLEGVFSKKMELEGGVHKAHDRNWGRIFVTLQGTALSFYTFKAPGMLAKHQLVQKTPDLPAGTKRGLLIKTYNLQHADVGIAADYLKRPYVIRVRAEAEQFLLSCKRIETFVQWLQSLCAAIDLAPPLDEREIPRDHSVPRSGRYRRRATTVRNTTRQPDATPAETIPEEPDTSSSIRNVSSTTINVSPTTTTSSPPSSSDADTITALETVNRNSSLSTSTSPRPYPRHLQTHLPSPSNNPSISPLDGKWRPVHKWGPMYDMMYARRCMAILTHRSPRKSNMMIMKGKQWVVDWATGKVTRWGPPDYREIEAECAAAAAGNLSSASMAVGFDEGSR